MNVKKAFPKKGDMQLFRLNELEEFICGRCHKSKKSKNVCIEGDEGLICNGCYGEALANLITGKEQYEC